MNTPENFRNYIEEHFNIQRLLTELADQNSFVYFIRSGTSTLGYLKLNSGPAQTEQMPQEALEIERIYVLKSCQRKGLGGELFKMAVRKALELQKQFLWLGVWEKNEKAIAFYEKNGFIKFGTHIFKLGDDNQTDYLYKYTL